MAIEHLSPNKVSDILSVATPTLMGLPNELLLRIVDFLGPPDLSCCDPDWLVVPAICRRFKDVAGKIRSWESGSVDGPNGARAEYGWRTFSPDEKRREGMPSETPDRGFRMDDNENRMSLRCHPSYKGGLVEYFNASLSISCDIFEPHKYAIQRLDRYFNSSAPLTHPRLNLSWLSSIRLSLFPDCNLVPRPGFSFAEAPCIVAPALQELDVSHYVIDWRCNGLKKLHIGMGDTPGYRYPPPQLLARLHDSRHTLEEVRLHKSLLRVPDVERDIRRAHVDDYPRLQVFEIHDDPHKASWLCWRIGFPAGRSLFITGPKESADLAYLRSLVCEYGRSTADPRPGRPAPHGALDALTIRPPNEYDAYGCYVTASKIAGGDQMTRNTLEEYAKRYTARYMDYTCGQDVRELDGKVPGIDPVFVTKLEWSATAWSVREGGSCSAQCSGLDGIKHLFFDGKDGRFVGGSIPNRGIDVWTAVLRQLSGVESLYIYDPCPAAFAPLLHDPGLLPNLKSLWIGRDEEPKDDSDLAGFPGDDRYGSEADYDSYSDDEDEEVTRQATASDDDAASLEDGEIPDDEHVSVPGGDAKPDVGSGRVGDSKDNGTSGDGASKPDGSIPKARTSPKWFCKIDAEALLKIARGRDLRCTLENVEIVSDDPRALEKALRIFGENGP